MNVDKVVNAEPIPGYRLIEPLGSGGFGEVWKCEAPGGLHKAIKFVRGDGDEIHGAGPAGAAQELQALQRIKALRHPYLIGLDRVEHVDGELLIVMELADCSLHDLLTEYQAAGRPGVPRDELLRYFAEAAEALDVLNQEHGLQHLDVKPRNLFLLSRHVKVADFGLVCSLAERDGSAPHAVQMGGGTPVYAAPESFLGSITLFSDQYSLAITYVELLTGAPPFPGKNFRQLALQHLQAEPDLGRLPEADRPVLARALAKEPRNRFPSCQAFVQALQTGDVGAAAPPPGSAPLRPKPATRTDIPVVALTATPVGPRRPPAAPRETVAEGPAVAPARNGTTPPAAPSRLLEAAAPEDPLAGLQFGECLARNATGETWSARARGGRERLVQYFFGLHFADARREADNLDRLRALRHRGLEPLEVVGGGDQRLAVVSDACDATLAGRLQECRRMGLPGLPRAELLARLDEAAETLDELLAKTGLRHLGLAPRRLALKDGRLRLLDFGVCELIHAAAGHKIAALNPRYAAPELFEGRVPPSADSYSLALIYAELLTGVHPFQAVNARNLVSAARRGQPDVSLVPAADRALLLVALHPDPARRFPDCSALVAALEGNGGPHPVGSRVLRTTPITGAAPEVMATPTTRATMRRVINGLVVGAAGDVEVREHRNVRYLLRPGRRLAHQFFAKPDGTETVRLDAFRRQWHAALLECESGRFTLQVPAAGAGWRRLLGLRPALQVRLEASRAGAAMTEFLVQIEPMRCGADEAGRLLEEMGPDLLESLRTCLQALPERRNQARLPFEQTVQVLPVLEDRTLGAAVASQATDISMRGMGLTMPCRPPSMRIHIRLPGETPTEEVAVPACVVRALPRKDGSYEVGVRFLVEEGP